MTVTTYATVATMLRTEDPDICAALNLLPDLVVVTEVPIRVPVVGRWGLHVQTRLTTGYSVLRFVSNTRIGPEWQVVTFYPNTTVVTKERVLDYLAGCAARQGGRT